jgi:hypothetical protein
MASYPLINGKRYDHSSVTIKVKGKDYIGIKSINYSDSLEPGKLRGTSAQKLGRTRGEYDGEASFEMYTEEASELLSDIGDGFMEVEFDIVVGYADEGQPTITDNIVGCRIKKQEASSSEGSDPNVRKFDLDIMYVKWNGLNPIKNMRE